jgi:hypothetical protein
MLLMHMGSFTSTYFVLEIFHSLLQHKNTVVTNVETLNGKLDVQPVIDPLLCSAGNMGDCQPGDCHFLTSLKIHGNCALTLCSDLPYWGNNEKPISSGQPKGQLPFIPGIVYHILLLCKIYYQYTLFLSFELSLSVFYETLS